MSSLGAKIFIGIFLEFLKAYIEHGTNMNVRPWSILEKLNKLADSTALLLYIKESTFPQKDEWMFSFFETLPKEKVNVKKIAFDNMEHSNTISAVAIPIYDKNNKLIAALSCPFFSNNTNEHHISEIVIAMKDISEKIGTTLNNMSY